MTPDPAFEAWIAEARGVDLVAEVERRGIKLSRGHDRAGPCPIERQGTDRFAVLVRQKIWNCRRCGTGGDVIKLVMLADGVDFVGACELLTGSPPPRGKVLTAEERAAIERRNAEREAEAARQRLQQEEASARYREEERERLYRQWQAGRPIPGSPAGYYLAARRIPLVPAGAALRFHPAMGYFVPEGKSFRMIHTGPAMIAAITGIDGRFRGLHSTWLTRTDGVWHKYSPGFDSKGEKLPEKKVRGSKKGNWIVLRRPAGAPQRQICGEGIETVLSAWHALASTGRLRESDLFASSVDLGNLGGKAAATVPHPNDFTLDTKGHRRPCRVGGPVPDLASPAMPVADGVREAILLGDGDSERFATENTLIRAGARIAALHAEVRAVRCAWADEGEDFNNMLQGAVA